MCRWGCYNYESVRLLFGFIEINFVFLKTYMCKFCGTRYCSDCLRGDFYGLMKEPDHCRKCNQVKIYSQKSFLYF
jgi:hypothetical protein